MEVDLFVCWFVCLFVFSLSEFRFHLRTSLAQFEKGGVTWMGQEVGMGCGVEVTDSTASPSPSPTPS